MSLEIIDRSGSESVWALDEGEAMTRIAGLKCEIMQMGANDSEINRIDGIILQLAEGRATPKEAVVLVESIRYGKQDYH